MDKLSWKTPQSQGRHKAQFSQSCSGCHGEDLGGARGPAPAGYAFLAKWSGQSVSDLFARTRTTMPQDNPGSLTPESYLDIVAFLLQANNFSAGIEPLE